MWLEEIGKTYNAKPEIYVYYKDEKIKADITGFSFNWKICKFFYSSLFDRGIVGLCDIVVKSISQEINNEN